MTHRHAFRRGVTPRPSEKDLRLWRRLVTRALLLTDAPGRADPPFLTAARKAAKAILPVGHQRSDSPFVRLVRIAESLAAAKGDARAVMALDARRMATAAGEVLDALEAGPRERKDIVG